MRKGAPQPPYPSCRGGPAAAHHDPPLVGELERIAGRQAVPVRTRIGAHWPLHATGVGLALLAFAPPEVQEQVLAALSVVVSYDDPGRSSWGPAVRAAAIGISRRLRASG